MENKMIEEQNAEMTDFLNQYPLEQRPLDETLSELKTNVSAIRSHLEKKPKKISMKQLDRKLDLILKILLQNGMVSQDELQQSCSPPKKMKRMHFKE